MPQLLVPPRPETRPVNVRLVLDDFERLEKLAKENRCTMSAVIRALLAKTWEKSPSR